MSMEKKRNPGPTGGYHLLLFFHRILPRWLFDALVGIGSFIAMLFMGPQRRASRAYLCLVLPREPTWRDVARHFDNFAQTLLFRLRVGATKDSRLQLPHWNGEEFMTLVKSGAQILYGSFHIGCSDLLGYALSDGFCPIYMIRLKVANSHDTERFSRTYKGVTILWMNDPQSVLFGINKAVGEGASIAMQCDRAEFSSRSEEFLFLNRKQKFPFTIYHMSAMYMMPVAFCFAVYNGVNVETYAPKPFFPVGGKKEILKAGREHFQQVLRDVETLLAEHPYHWFNFDSALTTDEGRNGAREDKVAIPDKEVAGSNV
jgi:predicted LPLAT superfamily acyltransferase